MSDLDWTAAACYEYPDPEHFFPETSNERYKAPNDELLLLQLNAIQALERCAVCPIRQACLAYAMEDLSTVDFGVYGGSLSMERRRLAGRSIRSVENHQGKIRAMARRQGLPEPDFSGIRITEGLRHQWERRTQD